MEENLTEAWVKFVRKLKDDNPFLKKSCNKVNKKFRKLKTLKLLNFVLPR
jgi:hypothetical protein